MTESPLIGKYVVVKQAGHWYSDRIGLSELAVIPQKRSRDYGNVRPGFTWLKTYQVVAINPNAVLVINDYGELRSLQYHEVVVPNEKTPNARAACPDEL